MNAFSFLTQNYEKLITLAVVLLILFGIYAIISLANIIISIITLARQKQIGDPWMKFCAIAGLIRAPLFIFTALKLNNGFLIAIMALFDISIAVSLSILDIKFGFHDRISKTSNKIVTEEYDEEFFENEMWFRHNQEKNERN